MSRREYQRSEEVGPIQRVIEYVMIGLFTTVLAIYRLFHHPILFELGALVGAGIGTVVILILNYLVPWFTLE